MTLAFVSDIHGASGRLRQVLSQVAEAQCDLLVLVGDLLAHGPRNGVFEGYDPLGCVPQLNAWADRIVAVRGNCDAEVDEMLLNFPALGDSATLFVDGQRFFVTHGHRFVGDDLPPLAPGTIVVSGHTHLPLIEARDGLVYFNPGSIALPKGGHPATWGLWTPSRGLECRTLDGAVYSPG